MSWHFTKLQVRRMPGIYPGFTLDALAAGVNIVHGPNGSGKTQTARAIHALLWPPESKLQAASVAATVQVDGQRWLVDFDAGRQLWQRDGSDASRPDLPPSSAASRYYLALHELLASENREFAEAILRESAGGWDVSAAVEKLGIVERPSRHDREARLLEESVKAVRDATETQTNLQEQERQLEDLQRERDESATAAGRVRKLGQAVAHALAVQNEHNAAVALTAFPAGMEQLVGNELETLKTIQDRRKKEISQIDALKELLRQATLAREGCKLQGAGVPPELLQALDGYCATLVDLRGEVRDATTGQAEAEAALGKSRHALRPNAGADLDENLAAIDLKAIGDLAALATESQALQANQKILNEKEAWLGGAKPPDNVRPLREAVVLVSHWLRMAPPATIEYGPLRRIALVAAAMIAVLAVALTVIVHLLWMIAIVPAALLVVWAWRTSPPKQNAAMSTIRQDLGRLNVGEPAAWSEEVVSAFLGDLIARLEAASLEDDKAKRWQAEETNKRDLARRTELLDQKRQQIISRLGVAPETDAVTLFMLVQNLDRWQVAHGLLARSLQKLRLAETAYQELLDQFAAALTPYGSAPVTDPESARAAVGNLRIRQDNYRTACSQIDDAQRKIEETSQRFNLIEADQKTLYARPGIGDGDEFQLRQRLDKRADFLKARRERDQAQHALQIAVAALQDAPALLTMPPDQVQQQLIEQRAREVGLQPVSEKIGDINGKVKTAKEGRDLETAIDGDRAARNSLARLRDRDCEVIAGWMLAERLRQETRDYSRPRVFVRARELFEEITRFRYKLEFEGGENPSFRATDTNTDRAHSLDELSSGTRVQLLLAVRIAFVEESEGPRRLPLLVDEALANADEQRARAIIEALIEIARRGRQIFYFTAQHDEVAKWESIIHGTPDVSINVIDLAAARQLAEVERFPLPAPPARPAPIPPPNGATRQQYAAILGGVPRPDVSEEGIGGTHLWNVVYDLPLLHRLLELRVSTWGQLKHLIDAGGAAIIPAEEVGALRRARATGAALEEIARNRRIGRGKPVTREVIAEAMPGSAFIDRTADLAGRLRTTARLLLALEKGEVKGFREKNLSDLRAFLREGGFYDPRAPLGDGEVRTNVMVACAIDLAAGHLTAEKIDELIAVTSDMLPDALTPGIPAS